MNLAACGAAEFAHQAPGQVPCCRLVRRADGVFEIEHDGIGIGLRVSQMVIHVKSDQLAPAGVPLALAVVESVSALRSEVASVVLAAAIMPP